VSAEHKALPLNYYLLDLGRELAYLGCMNENKITAAILAVAANSVRESPNTYNIADEQKMVMESSLLSG
jgi:hypothetical protein